MEKNIKNIEYNNKDRQNNFNNKKNLIDIANMSNEISLNKSGNISKNIFLSLPKINSLEQKGNKLFQKTLNLSIKNKRNKTKESFNYEFFDSQYGKLNLVALNLKDVYRYSNLPSQLPENVLLHQYIMTVMSIMMAEYCNNNLEDNFDLYTIIVKSLFHDFGEYKRIYSDRAKPINYALKFSIKSILIISLFLILLLLKSSKLKNQLTDNYNISSDKWIVMNAFNPPTDSIIELEKVIKDWKIVVIGNIKTNDTNWEIFKNSNKLIYLSLKSQNTLGYEILNYIPEDSYKRKNIGYLFAIQHGAKEIYELDENLDISIENFNLDYDIKHNQLCYVNQNEGIMVNPYPHFGETNIWPRGFLLKDMRANHNNSFYYAHSRQIQSKPLVYQGLINKIPDIDPLFIQINSKLVGHLDIKFSNTSFPHF